MDKRYQIFISSTFEDLKDERQAVLKAILEIDHMPAGMELFPASDEQAWQLICDVIDASDYYVLIVGGRYGSMDEEGLSYTEREYDYAVSSRKAIVPLLHKAPDNLPRGKTETRPGAWEKLQAFRSKIEKRHTCVYWDGAEDLKAKVIVGLTSATKRHPAVGWVRADQVPTGATIAELLRLRARITELESQAQKSATQPPPGTESLSQGDDKIELFTRYYGQKPGKKEARYSGTFRCTWNDIFAGVAPSMINEASDGDLRKAFQAALRSSATKHIEAEAEFQPGSLNMFTFNDSDIDTCIVQLRALGLIAESKKQRSLKDTSTYWSLTPYGDNVMVRLRAVHKSTMSDRPSEPGVTDLTNIEPEAV